MPARQEYTHQETSLSPIQQAAFDGAFKISPADQEGQKKERDELLHSPEFAKIKTAADLSFDRLYFSNHQLRMGRAVVGGPEHFALAQQIFDAMMTPKLIKMARQLQKEIAELPNDPAHVKSVTERLSRDVQHHLEKDFGDPDGATNDGEKYLSKFEGQNAYMTDKSLPVIQSNALARAAKQVMERMLQGKAYDGFLKEYLRIATFTPEDIKNIGADGGRVAHVLESKTDAQVKQKLQEMWPWLGRAMNHARGLNGDTQDLQHWQGVGLVDQGGTYQLAGTEKQPLAEEMREARTEGDNGRRKIEKRQQNELAERRAGEERKKVEAEQRKAAIEKMQGETRQQEREVDGLVSEVESAEQKVTAVRREAKIALEKKIEAEQKLSALKEPRVFGKEAYRKEKAAQEAIIADAAKKDQEVTEAEATLTKRKTAVSAARKILSTMKEEQTAFARAA